MSYLRSALSRRAAPVRPYLLLGPLAPEGSASCIQPAGFTASRDPKRSTSEKRKPKVNLPITPTTRAENLRKIARKRRKTLYLKKKQAERDAQQILRRPMTYWRVLRDGKRYRSFGGTRRA